MKGRCSVRCALEVTKKDYFEGITVKGSWTRPGGIESPPFFSLPDLLVPSDNHDYDRVPLSVYPICPPVLWMHLLLASSGSPIHIG